MYFLTILASLSQSTMVPRALRTNLAVRLIMPWRLPWAPTLTLPVPVILKRFLAPLLVFSLGILLAPYRAAHRAAACSSKQEKPPRHAPPGGLARVIVRMRQMRKSGRLPDVRCTNPG